MNQESKLQIKYTLFATLTNGGYMRAFESESHPGISGVIKKNSRKEAEIREFVVEGSDQVFDKPSLAIAEWERLRV